MICYQASNHSGQLKLNSSGETLEASAEDTSELAHTKHERVGVLIHQPLLKADPGHVNSPTILGHFVGITAGPRGKRRPQAKNTNAAVARLAGVHWLDKG